MEEGKRAMRALSPTSLRSVSPLPTSGEGRPKAGERATTQSHPSTTNSIRTRNVMDSGRPLCGVAKSFYVLRITFYGLIQRCFMHH